jgi:tetratricopeptide (TPR) repeat protein
MSAHHATVHARQCLLRRHLCLCSLIIGYVRAIWPAPRCSPAHWLQLLRRYSRSLTAAGSLRNTFVAQVATNRANACLKLARHDDAVADAELAIEADKAFAKAYLRRAQAWELKGEWEKAVRDLNKVGELDGELPGVQEKLEHAKKELKKSKRVDYYKVRGHRLVVHRLRKRHQLHRCRHKRVKFQGVTSAFWFVCGISRRPRALSC